MILGVMIFLIFIVFAGLMYANKLPAIFALPVMAMLISIAAGIPIENIAKTIISDGSYKLALPIIVVMFGAMLSQFVAKSGIAEVLVKNVAELSGDRTYIVAFSLTLVCALLFTVLGGLGAVIMVATIVLPIMISIGVSRLVAGCLFLLGLSLGGVFNLTNWQLYMSVMNIPQQTVFSYAIFLGSIFLAVTILFLAIEIRRGEKIMMFSRPLHEKKHLPKFALLTPFVPLVLVFGFSVFNLVFKPSAPFEFPIITALMIGLLYGVICINGDWQSRVNMLAKSIFDGIGSVAPAIVLIMGIGMLLNAVMHPKVSEGISPILTYIMPSNGLHYVLFFLVLAPLALYRGPLNIWGMGSGLIGLMLATKTLPPVAIMAALMSVGQIQGVCDPTNTHNVWIANFLDINVQTILKKTIFYMWLVTLLGLIVAVVRYF